MERIEKYGVFCRSFEGGWANDPDDAGGATMKGVTLKTFRAYRAAKGLARPSANDLRLITASEWNAVLRWGYWDRIRADEIKSEWVAYLLVDCVWMSGLGYVKKVQKLFGLTADGVVGPVTLRKLNSIDPKALFNILWKQRYNNLNYIATLRNNKKYLKGWLRRLNSVQFGYLKLNNGKILY